MDTKPTSSSALKARILLDSCTGRLSSESLKAMEEALDHAEKLTIIVGEVNPLTEYRGEDTTFYGSHAPHIARGDVFLGEGNFTPPTVDEMAKSLEVVGMGVRGCPFCEHEEAIRRRNAEWGPPPKGV